MNEQTRELSRLSNWVIILCFLVAVAIVQSVIKNMINEKWIKERDQVACAPVDVENTYPLVYLQSSSHPVNFEAKIQTFIEEYVHLTRDEKIIDYHKVSTDQRVDKARLSKNKEKAMYMSLGAEKATNEKKYIKSNEVFYKLEQENMGIKFLIDEIITNPVPLSNTIAVTVRGQYEGIYDRKEQKLQQLAPEFLGYREIRYMVQVDFPRLSMYDNKGYENKYGYYVVWSEEREITISEKRDYEDRSRERLLLETGDHTELVELFKKEDD